MKENNHSPKYSQERIQLTQFDPYTINCTWFISGVCSIFQKMQNYNILLSKTITSKYYIYNCSEQNAPTLQYMVAFLGKPAFSNPKKTCSQSTSFLCLYSKKQQWSLSILLYIQRTKTECDSVKLKMCRLEEDFTQKTQIQQDELHQVTNDFEYAIQVSQRDH